jgi:hypothetical protein
MVFFSSVSTREKVNNIQRVEGQETEDKAGVKFTEEKVGKIKKLKAAERRQQVHMEKGHGYSNFCRK